MLATPLDTWRSLKFISVSLRLNLGSFIAVLGGACQLPEYLQTSFLQLQNWLVEILTQGPDLPSPFASLQPSRQSCVFEAPRFPRHLSLVAEAPANPCLSSLPGGPGVKRGHVTYREGGGGRTLMDVSLLCQAQDHTCIQSSGFICQGIFKKLLSCSSSPSTPTPFGQLL